MITQTKYYSESIGTLPKGCASCVRGCKAVIFITGICSRNCYFCPTSDEKTKTDVTFANERKIDNSDNQKIIKEIEEEIARQKALGAGLTGGDPLAKLDRTTTIIKKLKSIHGKRFHIHLYTILNLLDEETLTTLYNAGLDEIRFHPDLDNEKLWNRISLAKKFDWDIGVEIPVIPRKEKETKKLIKFIENKVHFLNLNELEVADNKANKLLDMGAETKNYLSYAVKGSEQMAKELLEFVDKEKINLRVHYCTAKLKDGIQLTKRILRTGKNVKKDYEKITDEGLIIRGIIELEKKESSEKDIQKLKLIMEEMEKKNMKEGYVDELRRRIVTSTSNAKKIRKIMKKEDIVCSITKEYPTFDSLCVEKEIL